MKPIDTKKLVDINGAATYLLGCTISRTLPNGEVLRVRIVETESYHQDDPASHTFRGQTARNQAMFGSAGHAYIYFTYGVHWCFNVTAGEQGRGAGVLIRAAEPLEGLEAMRALRHPKLNSESKNRAAQILKRVQNDISLTNGPAKLAQALAIDKKLYGHDLTKPPLQIYEAEDHNFEIVRTTRIGISQAVDEIARFYIKDSPFVSKF